VLTDTLDGDDDAIEDGDPGDKRRNEVSPGRRTTERPKGKRLFGICASSMAHSAGLPWPAGDTLSQAPPLAHKHGEPRLLAGSVAGRVARPAMQQARERDGQLPRRGGHPQM
jgi:hypothetical protein